MKTQQRAIQNKVGTTKRSKKSKKEVITNEAIAKNQLKQLDFWCFMETQFQERSNKYKGNSLKLIKNRGNFKQSVK